MDDDWDSSSSGPAGVQFCVDPGTNFGRGRGFLPMVDESRYSNGPGHSNKSSNNNDDDGWKDDNPMSFSGGFKKSNYNADRFEDCDEGDSSYASGSGDFNRGRGRGGRGRGRGGRGRGRGDGGFRGRDNDGDNDNEDNRGRKDKDENSDAKPREVYIPPEPTNDEETMFGGGISCGINFDKYDKIEVKVTGENVPRPINSFESSGLRTYILDNVKKSGYATPTPVQKHAIPIIMDKRDLMACAQTGSGKTAAFLLPIIHVLLNEPQDLVLDSEHCEPQAVIISPTRELTLQIFNEARKFSHGSMVKTVVAYGGTAAYHQAQQVMRGCHILVATPGRLIDFVNRGRITFSSLRYFVLDEADRMLDLGFLPEIEKMMSHPTMVEMGLRQTLMFSATFPEEIQRLAWKFLNNYLFLAVGIVGGACSDVEQRFHLVAKFDKRPKLKNMLTQEGSEKTLVFVEMKRTADFIAAFLSENDYPTTSIHGDRLQREREEALSDFKSGRMGILVATAVAARGLDIKNVAHVINYDLPKSIDEYVHRIGRTGRVGNSGKATSFYDPEQDAHLAKDLIKILQQANQEIPPWLEKDASNTAFSSSYSRAGAFGGRDVRKFEDGGRGSDNMFGGNSDFNNAQPQQLEPEEDW
ncbi:hypothetical protein L9F63_007118 [Diploptera punctata]|uniref:RNA helicase n=1 Tax=Diploptera punctata TaxID=6984 RepID=A0AAD7Z8P1_DIPPU|nr:hypothetical protein L9F63_007118 [Diploptera punctata]